MITHREAEALISARLDQRLDPLTERELSAHLATCPDCRAFAQASRSLATGLRELPYLPPSSTVSRGVMARVEEGRSPWARAGNFLNATPVSVFSTLAVIAVVLLLGFFVLNRFVLDTATSPGENNQLASQPTVQATSPEDDTPVGTPGPTATSETMATEPPEPTATTIPPTETMEPEPTATDVPATETEVAPTATLEPTAIPTEPPEPTETPAHESSLQKASSSSPPASLTDLTGEASEITETPYQEPTATSAPTATSEATIEPTATSEATTGPTATPPPTETPPATSEPTATPPPTATPTEDEAPPIEPLDGQFAETPEGGGERASGMATATAGSEEDEVQIEPIATGDGTGAAATTESGQTIEPIGTADTPADDQETGDIEPDATQSPEATEAATDTASSDVPEGSNDLEAKSDVYGDIDGDPSGRLFLENGQLMYGPQAYPVKLTSASGVEASTISTDGGQAVALCVDGNCTDVSSESAAGVANDTPLSWVDGGLFYVRDVNNTLTYHYLVPDDSGVGAADDTILYDGGVNLEPTFPVYLAEDRLWIITTSGDWLVLSVHGGQLLSSDFANPHDLRFTSSGAQGLMVGYISGGQLVIAPSNEPGAPLTTLPFAGVDFDISPNGNHIVISTGSAIEIYDFNGTLVNSFANSNVQPGAVVWLDSGIIYHDDANGVSMQIPDPGV